MSVVFSPHPHMLILMACYPCSNQQRHVANAIGHTVDPVPCAVVRHPFRQLPLTSRIGVSTVPLSSAPWYCPAALPAPVS